MRGRFSSALPGSRFGDVLYWGRNKCGSGGDGGEGDKGFKLWGGVIILFFNGGLKMKWGVNRGKELLFGKGTLMLRFQTAQQECSKDLSISCDAGLQTTQQECSEDLSISCNAGLQTAQQEGSEDLSTSCDARS